MQIVSENTIADTDVDMHWCSEEFGDVKFGDKRLEARLVDTAAKLAAQPMAPINQACDDWADTKATYRLFDNEKVTPAKILQPHQVRTQERMRSQPLVLAIQDTTYLNYTHHPKTSGLGPIGTKKQKQQGLVMHSTLAMTPVGLPLGLLTQTIWMRAENEDRPSKAELKKRPIEEKESYKWLKALQETVALAPAEPQLVSVCDREADIYEYFSLAEQLETNILVRATQNRLLVDIEAGKLWDTVATELIAGHLKVEVPAQNGEPAREAIVAVRFRRVTLKPPQRPKFPDKDPLPEITINAILVQEVNPPATPLDWRLLTNVPVNSFEEAVECIRWYRIRWHIEVYHKVLKSGCNVEDCRLETADRLIRFLSLFSVIAWRLYWLTHMNRHHPDAPCTTILTDHEWRALDATVEHTTLPPEQIPTIGEATIWIAQLGGFLARKGDGDPGVTVIWRGWHRLHDISTIWLLFHPPSKLVGNS